MTITSYILAEKSESQKENLELLKQDNLINSRSMNYKMTKTSIHIHFKDYTDRNIALHDWNALFLQIADVHAPPRSKKVKGARQPWMTDEIKKLSFHRDYLKKKAVKLNSPAFYNSYKKCRNQVTERIKSAKTQCISKRI